MLRDVVITGLGRVGAHGRGRTELARALREAAPAPTHPCPTPDRLRRDVRPWALAASERRLDDPEVFASLVHIDARDTPRAPRGAIRDRVDEFAVTAGRLARDEAKISRSDARGELWVATSFGWTWHDEAGPDPSWEEWLTATATERLGGQVVAGEASGLAALADAACAIESGRIDRAVVLEVDTIDRPLLQLHRRWNALAPGVAGGPPIARPFDRHRRGAVLAEGATAIVLETPERARARAIRPRCRVSWELRARDDSAHPNGFGRQALRFGEAIRAQLRAADIRLRSIEGVVAAARGSVEGDAQEAGWIAGLFGKDGWPPVFAPIGTTGLGGGGFLAAAVLAAEGVPLGGSAGFCQRDPDLPVRPHPGALSPTPGRILVSTIASGGHAVWVLLDAP